MFTHCPECDTSFKVNPGLLIQAHGRHDGLINRRGVCPRQDRNGSRVFLAQTGRNTPFFPLLDF